MKSYPQYRDSGVEWIGDVPNWGTIQLRYAVEVHDSRRIPLNSSERAVRQGEYPYYGATGVVDYIDDYLFDGEFILLGEDGAPFFDRHKDKAFLVSGKFWVNNHAHILKAVNGFHSSYGTYALNCVDYKHYITGSTRDKLTQEQLRSIVIPSPSYKEQQVIADYLDHKTAVLDTLIAQKQRLIELLQEERTAVISTAVTQGLDPHAPRKPSGIPWLGHIPAHWEIVPLKFVAEIQSGLTLGSSYKGQETESRPYLRVANVQDGYLDLSTITTVELPITKIERYELQTGDVLMTEGGDFDKLGRGYVWEGQIEGCLHQNHVFAVRPEQSLIRSHYLALLTSSNHGKNYFTSSSQQTTNLATINQTTLGQFPLPLPRLKEQAKIIEYVSQKAAQIDNTIARTEKQIALLQEYRTTLISHAVTGKIDVRRPEVTVTSERPFT